MGHSLKISKKVIFLTFWLHFCNRCKFFALKSSNLAYATPRKYIQHIVYIIIFGARWNITMENAPPYPEINKQVVIKWKKLSKCQKMTFFYILRKLLIWPPRHFFGTGASFLLSNYRPNLPDATKIYITHSLRSKLWNDMEHNDGKRSNMPGNQRKVVTRSKTIDFDENFVDPPKPGKNHHFLSFQFTLFVFQIVL